MLRSLCVSVCLLTGVVATAGEVQTRFHQYTKRWAAHPDRAAVLGATRCGGGGTEWFAAGAVLPDGGILAAGSTLGPVFDPPGITALVLGRDGKPPAAVPALTDPKAMWNWAHPQATGFVVRYGPDLRTVQAAIRLPWGAGGITSAVCDARGRVYLAGPAGPAFALLGPCEDLTPASHGANPKAPAQASWIACLEPDLRRVAWLRRLNQPAGSAEVRLTAAGTLRLAAGDVYELSADGALLGSSVVQVAGRADKGGTRFAVNPLDGRCALGGDRQWPTGREPYRDPWLHIHRPDGQLDLQLYWWNGGYIGLDNVRLESDSAVRMLRWTDDGDLVFVGWSDGGNSVFNRMPFDLRRNAPNMNRLGMEGWGMGVLSQAWLVRLDGTTWQVEAGTNWLAYLAGENKPNGIGIDSLGTAADGSFLIAGSSAWGLIRTGNHLTPGGPPGGRYVAVLSPGLDVLRFSSCLPGSGQVQVVNSEPVAFASGMAKGRPLALVLTGAGETGAAYGDTWTAPTTVGAVQTTYGGGHLDAHLVVLDLGRGSTDAPLSATEPVRREAPKAKASPNHGLPTGLDDAPDAPAVPAGPPTAKPGGGDEAWLME